MDRIIINNILESNNNLKLFRERERERERERDGEREREREKERERKRERDKPGLIRVSSNSLRRLRNSSATLERLINKLTMICR